MSSLQKWFFRKTVAAFAEKAGIIVDGDGEIAIPDFGRFSVKHVAERQGVNPATGAKITIAARDKVVFKASDSLPYFSRKHSID